MRPARSSPCCSPASPADDDVPVHPSAPISHLLDQTLARLSSLPRSRFFDAVRASEDEIRQLTTIDAWFGGRIALRAAWHEVRVAGRSQG